MIQIARNLTDGVDGFFEGRRYLIHDRDPLYTQQFLSMLGEAGIESVKLPPRSPNLNPYAERFVRTIKEGCLDQMIFFGENSLRQAIHEFVIHYHRERNHQGLENRLITPMEKSVDLRQLSCGGKGWVGCSITITGRRHRHPTLGPQSHDMLKPPLSGDSTAKRVSCVRHARSSEALKKWRAVPIGPQPFLHTSGFEPCLLSWNQ